MSMLSAFKVSASGLAAERYRLDVISTNLANANTTKVDGRNPYRRRTVQLSEDPNGGVKVINTVDDMSEFRQVVDRDNPLADANGIVYYSNVDPIAEMVDMIGASRSYEANLNAFQATKQMIQRTLDILRA